MKCCTCEETGRRCGVDEGSRLGDLWYCEKRERKARSERAGIALRSAVVDGGSRRTQPYYQATSGADK